VLVALKQLAAGLVTRRIGHVDATTDHHLPQDVALDERTACEAPGK